MTVENSTSASRLEPVTYDRLNYKSVLKVTDTVAPLRLTPVNALVLAASSEAVRLPAVTHPVYEGSQLPHVPHSPRHHHLLLDDVGLGKVCPSLDVDEQLPEVSWGHDQGGVELDDVTLVQGEVVVRRQTPVEVVDDVGGIAATKAGRGHADLLVVVVQIDAQVLLQLLASPQRGEHGVLVHHPAVEQAVLRHLLCYRVVAIGVDGGQHQAGHEDHQAEGEAAEAVEERPLGGP